MKPMRPLNEVEMKLLREAAAGGKLRGSERTEDRAKQFLRKHRLIQFAGAPLRWSITDLGKDIVADFPEANQRSA